MLLYLCICYRTEPNVKKSHLVIYWGLSVDRILLWSLDVYWIWLKPQSPPCQFIIQTDMRRFPAEYRHFFYILCRLILWFGECNCYGEKKGFKALLPCEYCTQSTVHCIICTGKFRHSGSYISSVMEKVKTQEDWSPLIKRNNHSPHHSLL